MHYKHAFTALVAAAMLIGGAATSAGATTTNPVGLGVGSAFGESPQASTIAVIGDIPYGATKLAQFPANIAQINADPDVSLVAHVGDIKNGSSQCTDAYFATIRSDFDQFQKPFVYTPGDNEWTDCHRANNGGYVPTERLVKLRTDFFPVPGQTLGAHPRWVLTQALEPQNHAYVENTMWAQSGVVFAALNLPGSNNDLVPWFGVTPLSSAQQDEYSNRLRATLDWLDATFLAARLTGAKGISLLTQADMWDTAALAPGGDGLSGYDTVVQRIATLSRSFGKPVLLINGDSHTYRVDHPLTGSDPLYSIHPLTPSTLEAPNLTRVVVDGSANANDYLKLTLDPSSPSVFSWSRVAYH